MNDLVDALHRYADVSGQLDLRRPERLQEFLLEDLTRVRRNSVAGKHLGLHGRA